MTASVTAPDLPGFADPAADSQACFRAVLEALSEPGRIVPVCAHPRRSGSPQVPCC
jgi:alpha-D-ribose 1-methylphosphonate 5-triphosphate synthase subunit PhnH